MKKSVKIWWIITLLFAVGSYVFLIRLHHNPWYVFLGALVLYLGINYVLFLGTALGITGYVFQVFFNKENWAIPFYEQALKHNTKSAYALAAYGLILLKEGQNEKALPLFEKIQIINPSVMLDKIAFTNKAVCLWKMGEVDKAIETLNEMNTKFDYISASTYTTLGFLHLLKKDYEKALDYTQKALKDTPDHGPALDNLGQIYFYQNDLTKAEEYFKKALEEKSTMVDSKYYLGLVYEQQGNLDLAKEYFKKAYENKVTAFSTITFEQVKEKYDQYFSK